MMYLISKLLIFLILAMIAGVVTGWMTCRKRG